MSQDSYSKPFEDEVSLKDFLLGVKKVVQSMFRQWKSLTICLIIGLVLSFLWSRRHIPLYEASLTFMLSDDGAQVSTMSGIFGQLGLPMGSGRYNIDKLMEISRSRTIVQGALFKTVNIGDRADFVANHLLEIHDLRHKWSSENVSLASFSYTHNRTENFNDTENMVLKNLYRLIVGAAQNKQNGLLVADYGRDHYVMTFVVKSLSEDLSIFLAKGLYEELVAFYDKTSRQKKQSTYGILESKRDSISLALTTVEYELAKLKDRSLGEFTNEGNLKESRLETQSIILRAALAEAEKNLGLAQFTMESNTPLVQLIDEPIPPIQPTEYSKIRMILIGLILGLALFLFKEVVVFMLE